MGFDFYEFLLEHKGLLIPATSIVLIGVIIHLILKGIKEIYSGASTKNRLLMITIGVVLLLVIVVSLIAIYVFFLE